MGEPGMVYVLDGDAFRHEDGKSVVPRFFCTGEIVNRVPRFRTGYGWKEGTCRDQLEPDIMRRVGEPTFVVYRGEFLKIGH